MVFMSLEACSNGIDDDMNGFADCRDNACRNAPDGYVTVCDAELDCTNRRDDDGEDRAHRAGTG